jgi:urease accessory protein
MATTTPDTTSTAIIMATTITPMAATTEAALYRLLTWLSPGFPVGAYSYSHALEAAVEAVRVHDAGTLGTWIEGILAHGTASADAIFLAATWQAVRADDRAGFAASAERAAAMRGSAELALESTAQGAAFIGVVEATWNVPALGSWRASLPAGIAITYPVAVALAAALAGLPLPATLTAYLQAFAANLVSAGVRLIPLGQSDGQRVLARLESAVARATAAAPGRGLDDAATATPVIDLLSMRHEDQYTRLFRS